MKYEYLFFVSFFPSSILKNKKGASTEHIAIGEAKIKKSRTSSLRRCGSQNILRFSSVSGRSHA